MMQRKRGSPLLASMPHSNGATSWHSESRQATHCDWASLRERRQRAFCDDSKPWRASIDLVAPSTAVASSLSDRSALVLRHSASSRAPILLGSQAVCDGRASSARANGQKAITAAASTRDRRITFVARKQRWEGPVTGSPPCARDG